MNESLNAMSEWLQKWRGLDSEKKAQLSEFIQTLYLVWREEGVKNGFYRGLATQLIREFKNAMHLLRGIGWLTLVL